MRYEIDNELKNVATDIISKLNLDYIKADKLVFLRSHGSKSKRTIARIHGLPKIMQVALQFKAFYVIEIISENFDNLKHEDKIKTVIHELMHIPKGFGGGFRNHKNFVTRKGVDSAYTYYINKKSALL